MIAALVLGPQLQSEWPSRAESLSGIGVGFLVVGYGVRALIYPEPS